MAPSDQSGPVRLFAVVVAAWLLFGAVAGLPAAAASGATGATLGDDDGFLNDTLDTTTETVDTTGETLNTTLDTTTGTVDMTVETTTDTVDATLQETTDGIDTATGGTTDDTTDALTVATTGVTGATDTTADEVTETVDATGSTASATTDAATDAVSATAEGDLQGATGALGDATGEVVGFTTDRTTSLVETTGEVTTTLTGGTTDALTALTGDTSLSTTDAVVASGETTSGDALTAGTSGGVSSSERAARLDGDGDDAADAADGSGDGAPGGTSGEQSLATGSSGASTAFGGWEDLPISKDAATGGALGMLLVGAVGAAIRQASAAGGGAGTTARAAALASNGPLSRLARMLSVFRYSRYDDSDPLELDARRHVYEAISDQPGDPITAVSDRAEVNLSTARHHVKVLQREGLVATARVRNCERFYPAGTDDLELAAAMADECTADILDALVRLEPASVSGIAEEVDRSPSTVTHHLQKLEDDGIVVRERAGRSVENKLSEAARAALDPETERRQHAAERRLDTEARADAASGAQAD